MSKIFQKIRSTNSYSVQQIVAVLIRINHSPIINPFVKICYPITIVVFKVLIDTLQIEILFKMAYVQIRNVNNFRAERQMDVVVLI